MVQTSFFTVHQIRIALLCACPWSASRLFVSGWTLLHFSSSVPCSVTVRVVTRVVVWHWSMTGGSCGCEKLLTWGIADLYLKSGQNQVAKCSVHEHEGEVALHWPSQALGSKGTQNPSTCRRHWHPLILALVTSYWLIKAVGLAAFEVTSKPHLS